MMIYLNLKTLLITSFSIENLTSLLEVEIKNVNVLFRLSI